jgi:hypothetical protein
MIRPEVAAAMPDHVRDLYEYLARDAGARLDFSYDPVTGTLSYEVREGAGMCDFCDERGGPYSVWDARDIEQLSGAQIGDGIPQESVGAWHACIDCTPLVAGADRDALLKRSVRIMRAHERPAAHAALAEITRLSHAAFWRAKR